MKLIDHRWKLSVSKDNVERLLPILEKRLGEVKTSGGVKRKNPVGSQSHLEFHFYNNQANTQDVEHKVDQAVREAEVGFAELRKTEIVTWSS